ncbi:MAG: monovalent cation/H(+) antiporter subunit G [Pseudomonadota bacterium]
MSEVLDILLVVKPIVGAALCLVGGLLAVTGAIGILRFPDLYTRLHAASITDTGAVTIAVLGMMLLAPDFFVVFKLFAVWLFLFLTGPTSSHALANAAHVAGIEPLIGREALGEKEEAAP